MNRQLELQLESIAKQLEHVACGGPCKEEMIKRVLVSMHLLLEHVIKLADL